MAHDRPGAGAGDRAGGVVYCVVPRELADELHESLRLHFRNDRGIEVIVERRFQDRRAGTDRRTDAKRRRGADRRLSRSEAGRRVAERRSAPVVAEPPPLPRRLRRFADRLVFLRAPGAEDAEAEAREAAGLVVRAQAGDASAFTAIYMRYFDRVYGYLRIALRNAHDAEDCAQQVFANVFVALPDYAQRAGTPFRSWLFRIARNEAISHLRRSGRIEYHRPETIDQRREEELDAQAAAPVLDNRLEWLTDPDLLLLVERIPIAQQQAITLRYLLGLTTAETAAAIGTSPENIRQLEHRAIRFLEERLTALRRVPKRSRRATMLRRVKPLPVLGARRWGFYNGLSRERDR